MSDGTKGLPAGWIWTTLGYVITVRNGFAFKSSDYRESGVPLIRQTDLKGSLVDTNSAVRLPNNYFDIHTEFQVQRGDLLIGMSGSLGKVARYVSEEPALQNQRTGLIIHDAILDPRFIVLLLQFAEPQLLSSGKGIAVQNISAKDVEGCMIPFPPLGEQARIVAEVEKQFTRLDAGVAALNRAQANLKRYRASILKAACESRLVPTEAELARAEGHDYEPADRLLARILKERRAKWEADQLARMQAQGKIPKDDKWKEKYEKSAEPDTTDLPELPEGWAIASIDQLTSHITSGSRDWSKYYGKGQGVFLMAQNVRPGKLALTYQQLVDPPKNDRDRVRSQVRKDDLLVTIVGANTGDVCRVPKELPEYFVCQSVALMRPVDSEGSRFLEIYMTSEENGQRQYRRYLYGAGRPHLSFDQLKMTPILLPSVTEQHRIVAEVERRLSVIDELEASIDADLKRAERLRQSILKRAFEGKLVPQDPNDEPASVLLERIRAERQVEQKAMAKAICKPSQKSKRPQRVGAQAELFR
jgi:type I restriction enzyme, S subunit